MATSRCKWCNRSYDSESVAPWDFSGCCSTSCKSQLQAHKKGQRDRKNEKDAKFQGRVQQVNEVLGTANTIFGFANGAFQLVNKVLGPKDEGTGTHYCPQCRTRVNPIETKKGIGHILLGLFLLTLYIIPGVIYFMKVKGTKLICPECGGKIAW